MSYNLIDIEFGGNSCKIPTTFELDLDADLLDLLCISSNCGTEGDCDNCLLSKHTELIEDSKKIILDSTQLLQLIKTK